MAKHKIENFFGIVLYDIEMYGCRNGVWTNLPNDGEIRNEIIIRTDEFENEKEIVGNYNCQWFEKNKSAHTGTLKIIRHGSNPLGNSYDFLWSEKGSPAFEGVGYKMNNGQIAVSYWCA